MPVNNITRYLKVSVFNLLLCKSVEVTNVQVINSLYSHFYRSTAKKWICIFTEINLIVSFYLGLQLPNIAEDC